MAPSMGPLLFLISFLYYTSGQQWDASNYPNPTTGGFKQCNMRSSASLCDPDQVLTEAQRYRLNNDLNQLEAKTRQEHGRNFCEKKGITGAIALVKRVKGGSQQAVQAMANDMLRKWNLDRQCQKSVVIVVAVDDRKFWVARGPKVPVYGQELTDIFNSQKNQFANGEYSQALDNILKAIVDATLAKQGPGAAPAPGDDRGRAQPQPGTVGDKGKGGEGFKWPLSTKATLILLAIIVIVVIPILCCCCCLYFCCCKNKDDNRRQGPSDGETGGGGQPFTSSDTGPGGGGRGGGRFGNIGGILGGLGGGAAINGIMNRFRNRGGGGGAGGGGTGGGLPPQQGGGAYPPTDQYAGGKQPGLYPSVPKEDQGGGGGW